MKKYWISFKKDKKTIADIEIRKSALKIFINQKKGNLNAPKNIMEDMYGKGHLGNGDYRISVKNTENLEYIMSLVKQGVEG